MSHYVVDGEHLEDIADALRAKTGESGDLAFPEGMLGAIESLPNVLFEQQMGDGTEAMRFLNMPGEPKIFVLYSGVIAAGKTGSSVSERYVRNYSKTPGGNSGYGLFVMISGSGSSQTIYARGGNINGMTYSYGDGTLTISAGSSGYVFKNGTTYYLLYIY